MGDPAAKWNPQNDHFGPSSTLLDPNTPLISVLRDPNFMPTFQNQNELLIRRIGSEGAIKELYEIIKTTEERSLLNKITNIFFAQNSIVLKTVVTNPNVPTYLSEILQLPIPEALHRIGLVTQIITYSINNWSQETLMAFSQSPVFYPTLLLSLPLTSVFYSMLQFCLIPHHTSHTYLWGFFRACSEPCMKISENPTGWFDSPGTTACYSKEILEKITPHHRTLVYRVLATFLKGFNDNEFPFIVSSALPSLYAQTLKAENPFSENRDRHAHHSRHGSKNSQNSHSRSIDSDSSAGNLSAQQLIVRSSQCNDERAALFEMGMVIKGNREMVTSAIGILTNEPLNTQLAENALSYITAFCDGYQLEPIVNLLYRVLNPHEFLVADDEKSRPTHFLAQAAVKLVQELIERVDAPRFFAKLVQLSVAVSWNSKEREELRQRAICLSAASLVGNLPSWSGWEDFQAHVVEPFSQQEAFDRKMKISSKGWDDDDVEKLHNQAESIPMKECDRRRFVAVEFKDDSDSRSALSGSYIEEESEGEEAIFQTFQPRKGTSPGTVSASNIPPPSGFDPGARSKSIAGPMAGLEAQKNAVSNLSSDGKQSQSTSKKDKSKKSGKPPVPRPPSPSNSANGPDADKNCLLL